MAWPYHRDEPLKAKRVNPVTSQRLTNNPDGDLSWPLQQGDPQQLDLDRKRSSRLEVGNPWVMELLKTSLILQNVQLRLGFGVLKMPLERTSNNINH
ncbi:MULTISPECIES: DUF3153 domain-containing protein [Prochlorococcus]|uniref:DUF3153 domain-containing protein n=1 Tax=Prochlorococcus TaxID=1218 RepID=UPI0007B38891|nr:DUF3153 domain-containing protein [Prochlorococcus marinus]KZR62682.1 hypothetical protein PMIT1312_02148 [Prochlorococcus marinus str. MIT 1312]MCH2565489.1 hypothetical protein [Prochlorococcus sp. ALOHA_A2.0_51]NMO85253.1 hypothetical protein [Prochlorococcus sp. P1344]NMP07014.1 hypothetical protein [Prochlorococcus sp. P1361]NMP14441.1 hypothetical protein [Prochlorococcus sp.P1363]